MKEPYTEGLATYGDPESCVGVREGVGEALTGARIGRAIEPRNHISRAPTSLSEAEGYMDLGANSQPSTSPAGSKNLCMCGISMRENREIQLLPFSLARRAASARPVAALR